MGGDDRFEIRVALTHGGQLEVVAVRLRDAEREGLAPSVEQVEDDGSEHSRRHRGGGGAREGADAQQAGANDLRRRGGERPELRRAREETEELGHNIRGEAVDVLDLVKAVVHHERARAETCRSGDAGHVSVHPSVHSTDV